MRSSFILSIFALSFTISALPLENQEEDGPAWLASYGTHNCSGIPIGGEAGKFKFIGDSDNNYTTPFKPDPKAASFGIRTSRSITRVRFFNDESCKNKIGTYAFTPEKNRAPLGTFTRPGDNEIELPWICITREMSREFGAKCFQQGNSHDSPGSKDDMLCDTTRNKCISNNEFGDKYPPH